MQLLVGGLELLVGRLQLLVGRLQLGVRSLELGAELRVASDVREGDRHPERPGAVVEQRRDQHVVVSGLPVGPRPLDVRHPDRLALRERPLEERAQLDGPIAQLHVAQGPTELPGAQPEAGTHLLVGEHDRVVRVHHHLRHRDGIDRERAQPHFVRHAGPGLVIVGLGEERRVIGEGALRRPHEDAVPQVDRREQVGVHEEHLRPPEEEETRLVEREVESVENLPLRLEVEVDEGVAAREQVETRDRRIRDQVQASEDDRPAQLVAEDVAGRRALEVLLAQVGGDGLEILEAIAPLAGLRERALVDVGGEDLHSLAERLGAEQLRERDREAVRLLAAGAPGAPDADRSGGLGGEQLRQDVGAQAFPRWSVAKEARDVDQHGVEEGGELLGMHLEVVEVVAEALQVERLYPLGHTPRETRPLVPGEVESAAHPEILEERLERPAVFRFHHWTCPFITSVTSAGAISSSGRTKSTLPLSMAAPGMPKNSDVL